MRAASFALGLVLLSCASGVPPVIDSASFPPLSLDGGVWSGVGTVQAHATSATVRQLILQFVPGTQHGVALYEGPPVDTSGESSPFGVSLAFESTVPTGDYSLQITALDSNGNASAPVTVTVSLQ